MDFCGGLYVIYLYIFIYFFGGLYIKYLYIFFCKPGNGFLEWVNRLEPYPILKGKEP